MESPPQLYLHNHHLNIIWHFSPLKMHFTKQTKKNPKKTNKQKKEPNSDSLHKI